MPKYIELGAEGAITSAMIFGEDVEEKEEDQNGSDNDSCEQCSQ